MGMINPSIFDGNWKMGKGSAPEIRLLSRKVIVNGKPYLMKVGYNSASLAGSKNLKQKEEILKKIIERSEGQIEAFLKDSKENKYSHLTPLSRSIKKEYQKALALSPKEQLQFLKGDSPEQCLAERIDTKILGAKKAEKALGLIEKLKSMTKEGKVVLNGKEYFVPAADVYGKRKWELEIDGAQYEINEFEERAYNGVTTEDFLKRQELVLQAAIKYLDSKKIPNDDSLRRAIQSLDRAFKKDLKKAVFRVSWKKVKRGEDITEQYREINERATERIGQFAKDVQHLIDTAMGGKGFSIDDLDLFERDVVHTRDRPVIINTYYYNGKKFLNMHAPEAKDFKAVDESVPQKTIPSTIRNRFGLPNYITTFGGWVHSNGAVEITYEAMRHSSYPPINVESSFTRQAIAVDNVRQALRDLAFKALQTKPRDTSPDDPLEIPLRTMMLFTPKLGDFLRNRKKFLAGKWIGESEVLQLKETALALNMFHGRAIPLRFGKDTVWVKPDISMMNLGANAEAAGLGFFGKLPTVRLQDYINARGFIEFINEMENVLQHADLPAPIQGLMRDLDNMETSDESFIEAESCRIGKRAQNEKELRLMYARLDELYTAYLLRKKPLLKLKISCLKAKIKITEMAFYRADLRSFKCRKKGYLKNRTAIEGKESALRALFKEEILNAKTPEEEKRLKKLKDLRENFQLAKRIFYEDKYLSPEAVMEFQTIYIQTHSMLHNFVDFCCKSGEDRTGRVDDKVQEREVFRETHGRVNYSPKDYKMITKAIALIVHQFSVSQNTTEHNSNARGEQISPKVNPDIPAEHDRLQATMAKRVIKAAKSCTPSEEANQAIGRYKLISVAS